MEKSDDLLKKNSLETIFPLDIGRFLICPKRKLYGLAIKTVGVTPIRDAIIKIIEKGIKILYLSYSMPRKVGQLVTAIFFLDFTALKVNLDDLISDIKDIDLIVEFKPIKPKVVGFLIDNISFPIIVGENRAVLFRDIILKGFFVNLKKKMGVAANVLLYYLGFEAGISFAKSFDDIAKRLGINDKLQFLKDVGVDLFKCLGYGVIKIIRLERNPPYVMVRVYNNFECELCIDECTSKEPCSHFVRGMIAGALTELMGVQMLAKEIACIAKGDPYCEFEVIPER